MRVVYDMLNSRIHNDDDDDDEASTLFFLPNTITTATNTDSVTASIDSAAAAAPTPAAPLVLSSSSLISTLPRSSSRIRITKKHIDSSSISSGSNRFSNKKYEANKSIRRRGDDILNWLSVSGFASEVMIRAAVGDSPDTSKALRLLVKKQEVKRKGAGGRTDPFLYTVVSKETMQS